jgi:glycosyltransferase involved in cell wall biosynthesis
MTLTGRARDAGSRLLGSALGLDLAFYRGFHPDLASLTDTALVTHYIRVGRGERRLANLKAFVAREEASFGALPTGFDPALYADLNPDVARACPTSWEAISHYLRHGRAEGRRHAAFDPELYRDLHHPDAPLDVEALKRLYEREGGRPIANWSDLTRAHGLEPGPWIDAFDPVAYALLSPDWRRPAPTRAVAVEHFLRHGLAQLVPIAFDLRFEADYVREVRPAAAAASAAELYARWLVEDLPTGRPGSASAHLTRLGLDLPGFPEAFDWPPWARRTDLVDPSRWDVLDALIGAGLQGEPLPARQGHAGIDAFAQAAAEAFVAKGDPSSALAALGSMARPTPRARAARAQGLLDTGQWEAASRLYDGLLHDARANERLHRGALLAALRLDDLATAQRILQAGAERFSSSATWRDLASQAFEQAWLIGREHEALAIGRLLSPPLPLRPHAVGLTVRFGAEEVSIEALVDALVGARGLVLEDGTSATAARLRLAAEALGVPVIDAGARLDDAAQAAREKPRVLVVNTFFPPDNIGGATSVAAGNLRDWRASGALDEFEVVVACSDPGATAPGRIRPDVQMGVAVFRIGVARDGLADWRFEDEAVGAAFARLLDALRPDVVHFHSIQRLTASVVDACLKAGVPYVVTLHDGWWLSDWQFFVDGQGALPGHRQEAPPPGVSAQASAARKVFLGPRLAGAAATLAVSDWCARAYRDAGFAAVRSAPNGLPPHAPATRSPRREGPLRIGYVGGRARIKGYDLLEAALRRGRFEDLEAVIVDHQRPTGERHERWGRTPVRLRGPIAPEDMAAFYADIDVLVAPSIAPETYGLAVREALHAGLWVVCSDRGAVAEAVRPGENGFVIDVQDAEALIGVLEQMNQAPDRYRLPPAHRATPDWSTDQARMLASCYLDLAARS